MRKLDLQNSKDGYMVSVAVVLLIAAVLLASYYVYFLPKSEGYMSLSLLDSQKKAENYPTSLVLGVNSTFSVYVQVENYMGTSVDIQVRVNATKDINPVYTTVYNGTIDNKKTWETVATVSLNEVGNYSVTYELWTAGKGESFFEFTKNACVLNVQVKQESLQQP